MSRLSATSRGKFKILGARPNKPESWKPFECFVSPNLNGPPYTVSL